MKAQNEVLNKIAEAGSCVIVGRCADYVLKEYKPLRVFLYAPLDYRIRQVMENYNDNYAEALKFINKSDKRRGEYYQLTTTHEWCDVNNYDLLIDSSIGIDNVINTIKSYININK